MSAGSYTYDCAVFNSAFFITVVQDREPEETFSNIIFQHDQEL